MSSYENNYFPKSQRETVNTNYYRNKKGLNTLPDPILNKIINVSNYEDSRNINYLDRDFNSRYPKSYLQSNSSFIQPHGTIRTYYDEDKTRLKEIIEYRNGVKHGEYLEYYPNGNLRMKTNYNNDKIEGQYTLNFPDGSLEVNKTIRNGKTEGIVKKYFRDDHDEYQNTYTLTQYKNDKKNGKVKYYVDDILYSTAVYKNGKEYEITNYYENGAIRSKRKYDRNEDAREKHIKSEQINYDEKGKIKSIQHFKGDRYHGNTIFYDNNKPSRTVKYDNGRRSN
jgi:antitoxin component YwqK of YwqJK toxin-antitoxin module